MTMAAKPQEQNAKTYEALVSLIENSQGRLAPIIVSCDDLVLRQQIIEQYETEARQAKIQPYRVRLGKEPSVRAALAKLKDEQDYLQRGGEAVFTITGAETLLRITLKPDDEQSELDRFFGYLQWTREGLREFRYPIVLWVTHRILKEISRRAPDFWSWRKAVLRFAAETESAVPAVAQSLPSPSSVAPQTNDFLPPLEELQAEIQQLEATAPGSSTSSATSLATLYNQLGQVYANRVRTGKATDLVQEQAATIAAFQTAIQHYQQLDRKSAQADSLIQLGNFLYSQSRITDSTVLYQQSLQIYRAIGDVHGEGQTLNNLGLVYQSQGKWNEAIDSYQQSLQIYRTIGDLHGEGQTLGNLGNVYKDQGKWNEAIDSYQQSLQIFRTIGDLHGEGQTLGNLGNVYQSQGKWNEAIDCYQQDLHICRTLGDLHGEGQTLNNLGNVYKDQGKWNEAIDSYQQSLQIYRTIGDVHGEGQTLGNLGNVYKDQGKWNEAIDSYQQSLQIKRTIGDVHGEGQTLANLGKVHELQKDLKQAIDLWQEALTKINPDSPDYAIVTQWLQNAAPRRAGCDDFCC